MCGNHQDKGAGQETNNLITCGYINETITGK